MNCPKCGAEEIKCIGKEQHYRCLSFGYPDGFVQSVKCVHAELVILKDKLKVAGRLVSDAKDLVGDSAYPIGSAQHLFLRAAKQFLDENPELKGGKEG